MNERLLQLVRAEKETVIKYGTYDLVDKIYVGGFEQTVENTYSEQEEVYEGQADDYMMQVESDNTSENMDDVVNQIMTSNFRTGISQSEVDAFLAGMVV